MHWDDHKTPLNLKNRLKDIKSVKLVLNLVKKKRFPTGSQLSFTTMYFNGSVTLFFANSVSSGDFAHLRIPCYFQHRLQHLKMKENDNSENSMIKNNPFLV